MVISLFHIVTGRDLVPTCTTDTNSQFEFGMLHLQRSRSHQDMMRRNDCIRCERRVPCHGLLRRKQRRTRAVASAIPVNRSSRISHRSAGLEYCGGSGIPPRRNNRHAVDFSDDDFHDAWRAVRIPMVTALVIISGDVLAQMLVEARSITNLDTIRTMRLALFGLLVKGPLMAQFYRRVDMAFPSKALPHVLSKILVDQGPWSWFINGCFLLWVPIVEGRGVMVACESTRKNFVPLQMSAYQLWPAVHTLNYILVPPKGRILFVSCANLIWSVVCCIKARQ
mmetsp:Transcript_15376/g.29572  ORF Transcript_15376/g.29572 Transcript_15376/m.29572 type:complete len:281 (+) Transcript_15376:307-1149(+)